MIGIVSKATTTAQLTRAVECAKNAMRFVARNLHAAVIRRTAPVQLTSAKDFVLQFLADDHTVTEIANSLGKTQARISAQKRSAMEKLRVKSAPDLYELLSDWLVASHRRTTA